MHWSSGNKGKQVKSGEVACHITSLKGIFNGRLYKLVASHNMTKELEEKFELRKKGICEIGVPLVYILYAHLRLLQLQCRQTRPPTR